MCRSKLPRIIIFIILFFLTGTTGFSQVDLCSTPPKTAPIVSISPNPVNSQFILKYMAQGVNSAYISILNQATAVADNYILNTSLDEIEIDMTNHPMGIYSVFLVCDGEVQDIKNLIKQ